MSTKAYLRSGQLSMVLLFSSLALIIFHLVTGVAVGWVALIALITMNTSYYFLVIGHAKVSKRIRENLTVGRGFSSITGKEFPRD